jgi:hypothetical protein
MTTQSMKKLVPLCLATGAASLLISGCASAPVRHVDPDSSRTVLSVDKINMQDWNMAAEYVIKKMQEEFINSGKLESADGPGKPSVLAGRVRRWSCDHPLPLEPDVRLSPHPAQANAKPRVSGAGFTTV